MNTRLLPFFAVCDSLAEKACKQISVSEIALTVSNPYSYQNGPGITGRVRTFQTVR